MLLHTAVQFSQHHLLKRLFFPIVYSCLPFLRLMNHNCRGLFLGSLFYSILFYSPLIYVSVFEPVSCGTYGTIQYGRKSGSLIPQLCSSFSRLLWLLRIFCVSIRISNLFQFCEKCHQDFDNDCIDSVDCLGQYRLGLFFLFS